MRLKKTSGNSRESGRLMETHETHRDYRVLIRLIETARDS